MQNRIIEEGATRPRTAFMTAVDMVGEVRAGHASPVEIAEMVLADIDLVDGALNSFAAIDPDKVLDNARAVTERLGRGGEAPPLAGLPVSIKDLIAMRGYPTTFGSRLMKDNVIDVDAPSVERIAAAGGVLLGKSTTSEFGCKAVGDSPLTGITRNPWNTDLTPGGSSCGAAALVASGITPIAIGTDGGGSIRIPASLTGLVGIKGNFGRVPLFPPPATPTLGHVGPLARTVADAAMMMSVISGYDRRDPFSVAGPVPDYHGAMLRSPKGMKVAYSRTFGYARPRPEVTALTDAAVAALEGAGCEVILLEDVFEDPIDLWMAEFYAGVGTRLKSGLESRREEIDPDVADVLDIAVAQEMSAYYQTVFARYAFREKVRQIFEGFDALAAPVLPVPAFPVGRNMPDGFEDRNIVSWVSYTYPFNLTGQPAMSVPAGFTDDGLPVGLQLVAKLNDELPLFTLAATLESVRPWADRKPPGFA